MIVPTDREINRLMMQVLEYTEAGAGNYWQNERIRTVLKSLGKWPWIYTLDFCTDRNTLPEILDAVEAAGKEWHMASLLDKDITKGVVESAWILWRLPMRDVVIAALRALGKWPSEWQMP